MTKQITKPATKPAAPAAAPKAGDNQRAMLTQTTTLAASAETARAALVAHIVAICEGASEGFVRDVQRAAMIGFVAGMIATKGGIPVDASHIAAAAVTLAKKGDKQNETERKMAGAARVRWSGIMDKARAASPAVAAAAPKSAAKAAAAKATQAKRKARAGAANVTVTQGRTTKAAGAGITPTNNPAVPVAANKAEAVAEIHQRAALLAAFLDKNVKVLGPVATKEARDAAKALLKISAA